MRSALLFLLVLFSVSAIAVEEDCNEDGTPVQLKAIAKVVNAAEESATCPNRKKLKNLCMMIGSRVKDDQDESKFMYERRIKEAACINEKDSPTVQNEKIRKTWLAFETDLKCNNTQFDVTDGHLLKYAVTTYFDDFIDDVIKWKVNLNKIDASDNRTVLDYIQSQIERNKGNALEPKFQYYYKKLKTAGAKHRNEI